MLEGTVVINKLSIQANAFVEDQKRKSNREP